MTTPDEATTILAKFGEAVRKRRKELGLSQEELAFRSGLNRSYITDIERGVRNVAFINIVKLARALEISLSNLLSSF